MEISESAFPQMNEDRLTFPIEVDEKTPHASIFDSLPYVDNVLPEYEAYALSLIDEELASSLCPDSLHSRLNNIPNVSDDIPRFASASNLNFTEYEGLVSRDGQPRPISEGFAKNPISMEPVSALAQDEKEWEEHLSQVKIELEYQRSRLLNIEIQSQFESSMWKHHNVKLESQYAKPLAMCVEQQQIAVDEINSRRKNMQELEAGPKLQVMGNRWGEMISKNQRLVRAIQSLEEEVVNMRNIQSASLENDKQSKSGD